ncbi:MAG: hypothetical protein U5K43_10075 [Halofilum sp. (in: g-proteobacteria)]|nr:hypothetical protein [Halofilum sp. (in: g-proteobacteria)]
MTNVDIGDNWEELVSDPNLAHMGHNCNYLLSYEPRIKQAMIDAIHAEEYRNYAPPFGYNRLREQIRTDLGCPNTGSVVAQGGTDAIYQMMSTSWSWATRWIVPESWLAARPNRCRLARRQLHRDLRSTTPACGYKLTPERVREHVSTRPGCWPWLTRSIPSAGEDLRRRSRPCAKSPPSAGSTCCTTAPIAISPKARTTRRSAVTGVRCRHDEHLEELRLRGPARRRCGSRACSTS